MAKLNRKIKFNHLKDNYKLTVSFCENELKGMINNETLYLFLEEVSVISPIFTISQFPSLLLPIVEKYFQNEKDQYQLIKRIVADTYPIYPAIWNFVKKHKVTNNLYIDLDLFLSFKIREFQSLREKGV